MWRCDVIWFERNVDWHSLCSDGGDSSALSGRTLLCNGIVFALESKVPGLNLGAGTDSALSTSIGDEDVEKESMLQFICVDMYFITDYGVFCGINACLFKRNMIVYRPQHCGRWNHPTQVSSLQKGRNVVTEVILPHFRVRPFCVVVSSSLWNRRSWVWISEPELTRHSALHLLHYHRVCQSFCS